MIPDNNNKKLNRNTEITRVPFISKLKVEIKNKCITRPTLTKTFVVFVPSAHNPFGQL